MENKNSYHEIEIKMPSNYQEPALKKEIARHLKIKEFHYHILKKSLDARNKKNIFWLLRLAVFSPELPFKLPPLEKKLEIPYQKRKKRVVVVGMGPSGFFAALVLAQAGFEVKVLEQGKAVEERKNDIENFEKTGILNPLSNYSFGEGGAGAFSDGKLTSRNKHISLEREYILKTFIEAGAPPEIGYLAYPHIGSDILYQILPVLRKQLSLYQAEILFQSKVIGFEKKNNRVDSIQTDSKEWEADDFIFAPGHSSYHTYRLFLSHKIPFIVKPSAIGVRVEHPQKTVNYSQWGKESLPGVKAAEYKLTFQEKNSLPVYSFCMCPGGKIIPAASETGQSIVNGVSNYQRNSSFANSAVVAGFHLKDILNQDIKSVDALLWLIGLENKFFDLKKSYEIPAAKIEDFIKKKVSSALLASSYPFSLFPYDFDQLFPEVIAESLRKSMIQFSSKIRGFEKGQMMGLESKTSSLIQAVRNSEGLIEGFENLYITGEGSGFSGGIISSAADGIKAAIGIIQKYS